MNTEPRKAGRPAMEPTERKKPRAISLTDAEHQALIALAETKGLGVSEYVIKRLKLAQ